MLENVGRKITLIVVILGVAVGFLLLKETPFNLGLDLQGGTRLSYSVDFAEARKDGRIDPAEDENAVLDQMVAIIRNRVDPTGTLDAIIRRGGGNRIIIELPGTLGLPTVEADSTLLEPYQTDATSIELADASAFPDGGVIKLGDEQIRYEREGSTLRIVDRLQGTPRDLDVGERVELVKDDSFRAAIESLGQLSFQIVADAPVLAELGTDMPSEQEKLKTWGEANPGVPIVAFNRLPEADGGPHPRIIWYAARPQSEQQELAGLSEIDRATPVLRPEDEDNDFRGGDLAKVYYTQDSAGFPAVGFEMRASRKGDFARFTGRNENRRMAIVLNEEVASAPVIEERLPGGGIVRGRFSNEEVKDLVTVLRSGSLKIKPQLEYDERVGATLGEDYVRRGFYSAILAVVAVLAFMIVYYRRLGIFAATSLTVSFLMLMGGLSFLNATLTLPGIAGIILTIGMAVDANILIFDRIREETDKGRNVKQAVKNGFDLARSAILDANITTFLTAVILYKVGTGPVRGFAVTLMVGIVTSVLGALVVTRVLAHFALVKGAKSFTMGQWLVKADYGFLQKATGAFALSLVLVVGGVSWFVVTPETDKLGIDFLGGVEAQIVTAKPEAVDTIRQRLGAIEGAIGESSEVKPILASEGEGGYTSFRVNFKSEETEIGSDADIAPILQESLSDLLLENPVQVSLTEEGATGSAALTLFFMEAHPTEDIVASLATAGLSDAQVTEDERTNVYTATARAPGLTETEISSAIERAFQGKPDSTGKDYRFAQAIPSRTQVGPQVVGELRDKALLALGISLFVIVLYIRVRFAEYSYGFAAVAAVTHDVLITLGVLTLANFLGFINGEINLPMIAAFLTIIGYSLNDTIVIFDRVRENLPRMKAPLRDVLNTSINQTLSRTILTSFTTFLAVAILYGFNFGTGNVLETFSFAMMVGIITGTYSTIFIANPILLWLENRSGRATSGTGEASAKKKKDDEEAALAKA